MAGTLVEGELTTTDRVRFRVAIPDDDAAIRRLLRDHPMQGAIQLGFEREPDYFHGAGLAGSEDQTIAAFSKGRIVCMGRCSRRDCWINGRVAEVGYLAELRLDARARGQFAIVRDGYRFFRELQEPPPAELYYTSIAADNERARRFLERGARGMPEYRFLGELITMLVVVPRHPRVGPIKLVPATPACVPEAVQLLNESAKRYQLAAVWTEQSLLALEMRGLPLARVLLARDGSRIVACGALWDQRSFRQTVVRGYAPALAALKPIVNMAARIFDALRLPQVDDVLAHAFLSPLAFADEAGSMLLEFIESSFPAASSLGAEYLTLALPADDPRLPLLRRRFSTRIYRSRLYHVGWPDSTPPPPLLGGARFLPDVSLL